MTGAVHASTSDQSSPDRADRTPLPGHSHCSIHVARSVANSMSSSWSECVDAVSAGSDAAGADSDAASEVAAGSPAVVGPRDRLVRLGSRLRLAACLT